MAENGKKQFLIQAAVSMMFIVLLFLLIIGYTNRAIDKVTNEISTNTEIFVQGKAVEINKDLESGLEYLKTLEIVMANDKIEPISYMSAICETNKFKHVYIVDEAGNGIDEEGKPISLSDKEFWSSVDVSSDTQILPFLSDDSEANLFAVLKAEESSYIIGEYELDRFVNTLRTTEFDSLEVYVLTDGLGHAIPIGKNKDMGRAGRRVVTTSLGVGNVFFNAEINESYFARKLTSTRKPIDRLKNFTIVIAVVYLIVQGGYARSGQIKSRVENKELVVKADTDLLTGVYNKLATERKIKEYIDTHPDTPCMMFLIDVDNFKKINDTKGHAFGDEVLKTLGETISTQFRVTDIIGRIGGDEFMIFLKNIPNNEIAVKEAEKLMYYFKDFTAGGYVKYSPTASVGAAMFPAEGKNFDALYKAADAALYKSKENGRNQLTFCNSELGTVKVV